MQQIKPLLIFLFIYSLALTSAAQTNIQSTTQSTAAFYRARAERNLPFLVKDAALLNQIELDDAGITMYSLDKRTPEFRLQWQEIPHYLNVIYGSDYKAGLRFYDQKNIEPLQTATLASPYTRSYVDSIGDLRIAIDPGHIAATERQAYWERRFVKVKGNAIDQPNDLLLMEGELTYQTAQLLKDTLEKLGAEVFITRNEGEGAVGADFEQWYKEDFHSDLAKYVSLGEISHDRAKLLRESPRYFVFTNFYKYLDFIGRGRRINDFAPDLSLVIHYNVEEGNRRKEARYTQPTKNNFAMAFVPGAFTWGELKKKDARQDFVRLLVSPDLEESVRLAQIWMQMHTERLGVAPIPKNNNLMHPEKYCIPSRYAGVYHRNLYLTRAIEGPVVYGESLYQDNEDELKRLADRSFTAGNVITSKRVAEVAYAYLETIKEWVQQNRETAQVQ